MAADAESGKEVGRIKREGQGRALSRMFSRIDLDFINQFAETGVDNGPEAALQARGRQISQRLDVPSSRDRDGDRDEDSQSQAKFSGFASMFKNAPAQEPQTAKKSALNGLFDEDQDDQSMGPEDLSPYIHKRSDAKTRRGLYTGVLKRPVFTEPQASLADGVSEPGADEWQPQEAKDKPEIEVGFGKGTVSFVKPDLATLNALSESAKQKRIEAAAEKPLPPRHFNKSEQKWRGASSSHENAGTVAAFLGKLKDFCARVSSLYHRRVD